MSKNKTNPVYFVATSPTHPLDGCLMGQKAARTERDIKEIITAYCKEMFFEVASDFHFNWEDNEVTFETKTEWDEEPEEHMAYIVPIPMWDGELYDTKQER